MELVDVRYLGVSENSRLYNPLDSGLINTYFINTSFGGANDYIEAFVYDLAGTIIRSEYDLLSYKPSSMVDPVSGQASTINLDPVADLNTLGIDRGVVVLEYRFLRKLLNSDIANRFWIKEISPSRKEIKVVRQDLSNAELLSAFGDFNNSLAVDAYYPDFYLNFGIGRDVLAVNALYLEEDNEGYILFKLYEPLPEEFDTRSLFWVTQRAAEPIQFQVSIQVEAEQEASTPFLRGPNYRVDVNSRVGQTTPYYNYNSLFSTTVTSSLQQVKSYLEDKAVGINVDFSDFENFIHFSSAVERLENFAYKVTLIESYESSSLALGAVATGSVTSTLISSSRTLIQSNINSIIEKFDPYEYYLYYTSGSTAWPKSTSTIPYRLYSVTSSQAINWLGDSETPGSMLYSASLYDSLNEDALRYTTPQYIREDDENAPYMTFLDMIGQHFDNVWLYYKDVTNRHSAENNPQKGISLDLVKEALHSFGINSYTNTNISDDLYYSLIGVGPSGGLLPPTGSEVITTYVTSSLQTLPADVLQKEVYKRLYHNLPYLLKTKGTRRGVKALIACYGIPSSILTVNEFGGYDLDHDNFLGLPRNEKVTTGSMQNLTGSALSPFITQQIFSSSFDKNSHVVEVGFSPADSINADITSSLPTLDISQLIGNPALQYSSSYEALARQARTYFDANYTRGYNVWDFIRTIKYYNNSLFKLIKDFVPARANLSTGIIVKPHILERSKYARHEPSASFEQYSQSLEILAVTGSDAGEIKFSTEVRGYYTSSLGYIPYTSSTGVEKFTGEFQGTDLVVTSQTSVQRRPEISSNTSPLVGLVTHSFNPLLHNISGSVRSQRFFDLDYTTDQLIPVNYGLITKSMQDSATNNYQTYTDPYSPYAYLQDSNYASKTFTSLRYDGSSTRSATFTDYTSGDSSYGKTAAVDKIKFQYAYLVEIYATTRQLPGRCNAQIKYILDNDQNVLDLTKLNTNIFFTQNIYKSGEQVNISLFDYDPTAPYVQYLANNSSLALYEGGWRYSPLLFRLLGSENLTFSYLTSLTQTSTTTTPGLASPNPNNAVGTFTGVGLNGTITSAPGQTYTLGFTASHDDGTYGIIDQNLQLNILITWTGPGAPPAPSSYGIYLYASSGSASPLTGSITTVGDYSFLGQWYNAAGGSTQATATVSRVYAYDTVSTTTFSYVTGAIDAQPDWYAVSNRVVKLSHSQSALYGQAVFSGSNSEFDTPVFPLYLEKGDMIRFYNTASGFSRDEEYRVLSAALTSDPTGSFVYVTLDRDLNPLVTDAGGIPSTISKYIVLKHVPDETNLILEYDMRNRLYQDGLIYPQYLEQEQKDQAGNTLKSLKAQNLI